MGKGYNNALKLNYRRLKQVSVSPMLYLCPGSEPPQPQHEPPPPMHHAFTTTRQKKQSSEIYALSMLGEAIVWQNGFLRLFDIRSTTTLDPPTLDPLHCHVIRFTIIWWACYCTDYNKTFIVYCYLHCNIGYQTRNKYDARESEWAQSNLSCVYVVIYYDKTLMCNGNFKQVHDSIFPPVWSQLCSLRQTGGPNLQAWFWIMKCDGGWSSQWTWFPRR